LISATSNLAVANRLHIAYAQKVATATK